MIRPRTRDVHTCSGGLASRSQRLAAWMMPTPSSQEPRPAESWAMRSLRHRMSTVTVCTTRPSAFLWARGHRGRRGNAAVLGRIPICGRYLRGRRRGLQLHRHGRKRPGRSHGPRYRRHQRRRLRRPGHLRAQRHQHLRIEERHGPLALRSLSQRAAQWGHTWPPRRACGARAPPLSSSWPW